jgi:uncharacterized protein
MEAHEVILALIKHNGGEIKGRTKLQKLVFFANVMFNLDISFRPYYFGPYSDDVAISTNYLIAMNLINEAQEHFPDMQFGTSYESVRYTYKLTSNGEDYFKYIEGKFPDKVNEFKKIINAVNNYQDSEVSYKELSIAAKVYFILTNSEEKLDITKFQEEAKSLNWDISSDQITKSFKLLETILSAA